MTADAPVTLLAQEDFGDVESLVYLHTDAGVFALANGEFTFDEKAKTGAVSITHTWAKSDFETFVKVADFQLDKLEPTGIVGVFTAKLITARFYTPAMDNPFTDAIEEDEADLFSEADAAYLNTGYDALPPEVPGLKGKVLVELFHGSTDKISEKVQALLRH